MTKIIKEKRTERLYIKLTEIEKSKIIEEMKSKNLSILAEFSRSKLLNIDQNKLTENKNYQQIFSCYKSIKNEIANASKALKVIAKSAEKSGYKFDLIEKHLEILEINSQSIFIELTSKNEQSK